MPDDAVILAETPDFVAVRDIKSCGCPKDFVAVLALPRTRITGIEDPKRPNAIWEFAWSVARKLIADELEIGLVINPEVARTQHHLHVHALRLKPGMRAKLDAGATSGRIGKPAGASVSKVDTIRDLFTAAEARVGADAMASHGILVARARDGGFLLVLTDRVSPQKLTVNTCDPKPRDEAS
jgi:CDP-diacylglycerol pyrophosphatase